MVNKVKKFRGKVMRAFAGFLIFMLACTAASRGIYAYRMPQVTVAEAQSGSISHGFEAVGTVRAISRKAVVAAGGIRVRKVCVEEGDTVKKGETLFRLDGEDIRKKTGAIRSEISELEKELQKQDRERRKEEEEREREARERKEEKRRRKKRQKEDAQTLDASLRKEIQKVKEQYRSAAKELSLYPSWERYWEDAENSSQEYLTLRAAAEKQGAAKEEQEAFSIFSSTFESAAKKEWRQGKKALEDACRTAREALLDARENRREQLSQQKRQYERDNEDAEYAEPDGGAAPDASDQGTEERIRDKISQKSRKIKEYEQLLKNKGRVLCERDGVIERIAVSVGENTPDGASIVYRDASGGFRFTASIDSDQRKQLNVGDEVSLSFQEGIIKKEGVAITGIKSNKDGGYEVSAEVSDQQIAEGEIGTMKVKSESDRWDCYVPVSGLYLSGTEKYVLVLREQETFLGREYSVEKRKVEVVDKNDEFAALKGAPLESEEQIVVASDRELKPGGRVRMAEGDE